MNGSSEEDDMDKDCEDHDLLMKLDERVEQIMENHIPHLRAEMKEIKHWIMGIAGSIFLAVLAMVLDKLLK